CIYPMNGYNGFALYPHEHIGIRLSDARTLSFSQYKDWQHKMVLQQAVTFTHPSSFELHRLLRAIDHNCLLSKLPQSALAARDEYLQPISTIEESLKDFPHILFNTNALCERCNFDFDFKKIKNKSTFTGSSYDDRLLLEKLAYEGMIYRYGKSNKTARERVNKEIDIIHSLGFSSYFLITWDMIRYSMSRGFYHVGRGSGANSVVAYCLRITDVDPIELDLYFERFLNPKRKSPPDFDIDYSWKERDEVLDYLFKRYGSKHTALLGAMSTFKGKSIIRELGKVFGLPKSEIDELVRNPNAVKNRNHISDQIFEYGSMMADFPNLRSIHAGGVLISEKPIAAYAALDMPPKGFQTTQWDMYTAEDIGFEKLDVLSQRGIGHIKEAAIVVESNLGIKVDVHNIADFKKDKKVNEQLRQGDCLGCFYIESPAMRGLLKKLRCSDYLSLVAASSIIRPGVAKSGMMREYIHRFHHPDGFEYLHPVMEEQLQETYGVMVYQEDVLKVGHHFGGLDLADADYLRRMMSGKHRSASHMQYIRNKFFDHCQQKHYPQSISDEVWRQMESFAGYSFSKAHSASFAVESYQSLFLKTHYPREFMVAVINNFGGFYNTWVYVHEARKAGANIHLPCLNNSDYYTNIKGKDIHLGLVHIQNLEQNTAYKILQERERNGPYQSLEDLCDRAAVSLEQLILLIRLQALRFTGKSKQQILWDAHLLLNKQRSSNIDHPRLFKSEVKKFALPHLENNPIEYAYDEIELLGFPVSLSRFDLLQSKQRGDIMANNMLQHKGQKVRMMGELVTRKYVTTVKKQLMNFGTFLDFEGNFFDSIHFPDALEKYPFQGSGVYLLYGMISEEFDFPSIEVEKMLILPIQPDPRA
ncbi:MAG TPA: DNA polymerase III subunit alpha, partial [Bacteroidia bacterium]|nr:DNA polymerase III subunit alpha [Bacteroidia bacterium]